MTINFPSPKKLIIQQEQSVTVNSLDLDHISDNPNTKIVTAIFKNTITTYPLVLWSGADYDSIGDWTTQNATDQIAKLLGL